MCKTTTLPREGFNYCRCFYTECFSHHQGESEAWTNVATYSTTEDTRHWRSKVGEDSSSLSKLFSELKLVTDNLLFIYAEANWEATESLPNLMFDAAVFLHKKPSLLLSISLGDLPVNLL